MGPGAAREASGAAGPISAPRSTDLGTKIDRPRHEDRPTSAGRVGAIWAQDAGGLLGADGGMLWRVPADFRHFKDSTLGGVVIMGRTTWDSIGSALPGRRSIVLTRRPGWSAPGAEPAASLDEALAAAAAAQPGLGEDPRDPSLHHEPRIWVIGGGSVYDEALREGFLDELVVTTLDLDAAARAREAGTGPSAVVRAPAIDERDWTRSEELSDPVGSWRERSGNARWRVDHWLRR